ncbi:MAG TPA: hypothetical protein VM778_01185 [Gemmatimonadota bacterium]|nr:hypothetical protein [Gemmatimonadota bacterium]
MVPPLGNIQAVTVANGQASVDLGFQQGSEEYVLILQALRPGSVGIFETFVNGVGVTLSARGLASAAQLETLVADDAPIREMERRILATLPRIDPPRRALQPAQDLGSQRNFFVVNKTGSIQITNPEDFDVVTATLRYIGTRALIYADDTGLLLTDAMVQQIGSRFDDQIHPANVTAFGPESDIDGNGRVIILLSTRVNALTTQEIVDQGARIVGFFFGIDLQHHPTQNPFSNNTEVFYAVVPDPNRVHGAARVSIEEYVALLSSVVAHEFEHMISFNHHVLIAGGSPEALWLDEGLAHMAETVNDMHFQNQLRSAFFLHSPPTTTLTGGGNSLDERGAAWLFVHYMEDRFPGVLRKLVAGAGRNVGTVNVEAATGTTFSSFFDQWATTLLVDGGTIPNPATFESSIDLRGDFEEAKLLLNQSEPNRIPGNYLGIRFGTATQSIVLQQEGTTAAYVQVRSAGAGAARVVVDGDPGAQMRVTVVRVK